MSKVQDIMTREVLVVGPDDTLQQAALCMRDSNVGSVPVCDGRRLLGMITDRDIAVRAAANGLSPTATRVRDVMSTDLCWCAETQTAADVLEQMGGRQLRRLPVLNEQNDLVGIVSLGDLATRQEVSTAEALRDISAPTPPGTPS